MHFFITAIKICHTHIRPTQTSENIFSVDSLNFVIKELGGQPNPREEGTATWYILWRLVGYGFRACS